MDTYGYVRVSTKEQNEDRQMILFTVVQDLQGPLVFRGPLWYTNFEPVVDFEEEGCPVLTNQEVEKVVEELCGSVASLFPQNKIEAILFGSYARGDAEPG